MKHAAIALLMLVACTAGARADYYEHLVRTTDALKLALSDAMHKLQASATP